MNTQITSYKKYFGINKKWMATLIKKIELNDYTAGRVIYTNE